MPDNLPLIFDVKRGTTEDGPGIRTTVFFKGCPLTCKWCQNVEGIDPGVEIGFYPNCCIGCLDCAEACPEGAIMKDDGSRIDRSRCTRCGVCVEVCPGRGLRKIGRHYEIEELLELLLRDSSFYEKSGGGVTLSGGEPTLWLEYCGTLLKRLKSERIHTAVQTCGHFEYNAFRREMLPWLDLVMYDLKIIDPENHIEHTGCDNRIILQNLVLLSKDSVSVLPRIPLIPDLTTSEENLAGIKQFLQMNGFMEWSFLPFNPLGFSKWEHIGKAKPLLPRRGDNNCSIYNAFR